MINSLICFYTANPSRGTAKFRGPIWWLNFRRCAAKVGGVGGGVIREAETRAGHGRQDGCIAICWLVTLRAQMGLESPGRARRRADETKLGGQRSRGGVYVQRRQEKRETREWEWCETFFSLTTHDEKPSGGLSGGASSTSLVGDGSTCQRDFTISLAERSSFPLSPLPSLFSIFLVSTLICKLLSSYKLRLSLTCKAGL